MTVQVFGTWQPHSTLAGVYQNGRLQFAMMHCVPVSSAYGGEVWQHFFPETIQNSMGIWKTMQIPNTAWALIHKIEDQGVFDVLYIRIDQAQPDEAVLVGEVKGFAFILLRWGPALEAFEELREKMLPLYVMKTRVDALLASVFLGAVSAVVGGIWTWWSSGRMSWRIWAVAGLAITAIGFVFLLWPHAKRLEAKLRTAKIPEPNSKFE